MTVNLESGMPSSRDAMFRFESELAAARMQGVRILRVIHGYGSSGTGGAIRVEVRRRLAALVKRGQIRHAVCGEDYSDSNDVGRAMIKRHPVLANTIRTDRNNDGITFVEL